MKTFNAVWDIKQNIYSMIIRVTFNNQRSEKSYLLVGLSPLNSHSLFQSIEFVKSCSGDIIHRDDSTAFGDPIEIWFPATFSY